MFASYLIAHKLLKDTVFSPVLIRNPKLIGRDTVEGGSHHHKQQGREGTRWRGRKSTEEDTSVEEKGSNLVA